MTGVVFIAAFTTRSAEGHITLDEPAASIVVKSGSQVTLSSRITLSHVLESWNVSYPTTGINGSWTSIVEGLPPGNPDIDSIHTYDWTVPQLDTNEARLRVEMVNTTPNDLAYGEGDFTIEEVEVQALSQWGLVVLGIVVAMAGTLVLRRRCFLT